MAFVFFFCLIALALYLWLIGNLMGIIPAFRQRCPSETPGQVALTVLIPFRNEAAHIPVLVEALENQDFPSGWQVACLWINDHSTDGGEKLLQQKSGHLIHQVINLPEAIDGKKAALQAGLTAAESQWILCTDADTIPGPGWIRLMVSYAAGQKWQFATGGVVLTGNAWLQRLQHWDMAAMMAITWLGWERQWWMLANGASLLLSREAAIQAGGWNQQPMASGDDLFMVRQLAERGFRGGFVANRDALVSTPALSSWRGLLAQRKRWATKLRALQDSGIWVLGVYLLLVEWMPWLLLVAGLIWKPVFMVAGVVVLAVKWFWDTWFLRMLGRIIGRTVPFMESLWIQPMHALFMLISAFYSILGRSYTWKGRKVQ
ncbi:MAG: glycosyltransferase [Lewinellaceae bacterium]|nr:glycosyltransferase [Lewinellaceae bacterium]